MSEMEKDARDLLYKTLMTIVVGSLWMLVNMTVGLYFGWYFFSERPSTGNYICYAFSLITLAALLRYYYKLWTR